MHSSTLALGPPANDELIEDPVFSFMQDQGKRWGSLQREATRNKDILTLDNDMAVPLRPTGDRGGDGEPSEQEISRETRSNTATADGRDMGPDIALN